MLRSGAACAAGVCAIGAAGCGDSVIDHKKAEALVGRYVAVDPTLPPIKETKCPSDLPVKAGKSFQCTVRFTDGRRGVATVQIVDKTGRAEIPLGGVRIVR